MIVNQANLHGLTVGYSTAFNKSFDTTQSNYQKVATVVPSTTGEQDYNDVNGNLVNLFRCIKYHPDAVQEELRYILISREQFFDAREQIETRGMTDIQRAARFFILIKESFGTDLRSFGLRSRDMEKAKEYLSEVSKRLNKVVIENLDFEKILKNYDKTDALFYLDPPYYETEKYYPDRFMPEDHERLKAALDGIKGKFVL